MIPAISISGLLYAAVCLPFASWSVLPSQSVVAVGMMGVVVTVAFALITIAPRYIPAAEVSLILPLETVGGIALAWMFLDEIPGAMTLLGACIVLLALMGHSYFVLRMTRSPRRAG